MRNTLHKSTDPFLVVPKYLGYKIIFIILIIGRSVGFEVNKNCVTFIQFIPTDDTVPTFKEIF